MKYPVGMLTLLCLTLLASCEKKDSGTTGNAEVTTEAGQTYVQRCAGCHGVSGGGANAPALVGEKAPQWTQENFLTALRKGTVDGRTLNVVMPRYAESQLSDEEIESLRQHILTLKP